MRSKLLIAGLLLALLPLTAKAGDRYGRGYYSGRGSIGGSFGHYDRGDRYYGGGYYGGHSHSSFGFPLGFSDRDYYYDDYAPSYYTSSYYAPSYYYAPPPVYYYSPPVVYREYPRYYYAPRTDFGFRFNYRR